MAGTEGRVEQINIGPSGEVPAPVDRVEAHAGRGLVGNRYYKERGMKRGQALTLIAAEALEGLQVEHGIELSAAESRRNVLTRGIDLNALVGKRFRVGSLECEGVELCEPCKSLERATQPGVIKGLAHRGGLNADILTDGVISIGDEVVATT
jgi:MOSC domain-containing protein YiiM